LFQYAFARNVGLLNGVNKIIEDPKYCRTDLNFLGLTQSCENLPYLYKILHHHRNHLDKILNFVLRNSPFGYETIKQHENDPVIIPRTHKHISIHGRLQDFRYWEQNSSFILEEIKTAVLKKSSQNFSKENGHLAVHIRRGDYLKPEFSNSIGVLSKQYFQQAIKMVLDTNEIHRTIIFTDQPEHEDVQQFGKDIDMEIRCNANKYDDLVEMMCCSHIIISNSTFSWWAATLGFGLNSECVWAPSSFKKRIPLKSRLMCREIGTYVQFIGHNI